MIGRCTVVAMDALSSRGLSWAVTLFCLSGTMWSPAQPKFVQQNTFASLIRLSNEKRDPGCLGDM